MSSAGKGSWIVSERAFAVTMWTLYVIALLFLASRFAVRNSTKGKLMGSDYFLVAAVPFLLTRFSLLQSVIHCLYLTGDIITDKDRNALLQPANASRRLVAAIELLWVAIYCVKFCYLAQFKFYKPLYAYVVAALTRYYWTTTILCIIAFLFTIVQPIVLCPIRENCHYLDGSDTKSWEVAINVIDIVTAVLVILIPISLIHMVNNARSSTIVNFVFKSLSVFNIVVAATRLALQYDTEADRIRYVSVTFLLVIEATVALIMVSISGYRVVFLDRLAGWKRRMTTQSTHLTVRHPTAAGGSEYNAGRAKRLAQQNGLLSGLPTLSTT